MASSAYSMTGVEMGLRTITFRLKLFIKTLLLIPTVGRMVYGCLYLSEKVFAKIHGRLVRYRVTVPAHPNLKDPKVVDRLYGPMLKYYRTLRHAVDRLPYRPMISVIIPVYKVKREYFWDALQSVAIQTYGNWEMCLVDDASGQSHVAEVVDEFSKRFPGRVKFKVNESNQHISVTSNNCLGLASGDYCVLLDHDDRLYPNALGEMVRYINYHQRPDILYSDERVIDSLGNNFHGPFFKPDWSPFFHLSVNYTTHLTCYRTDLVKQIGGFRAGLEGAQDHDLMLRMVEASSKKVVHVPLCLYQWRAHEASTASGAEAKPYAATAGERCVRDAIARRGRPGKVAWEPATLHYRVTFDLPKPAPMVSIIIPTKDQFRFISQCIDSIFTKTSYPNFEVIVIDNGTTDRQCLDYFEAIKRRESGRIKIIRDEGPFNFAAMNNRGAQEARGDYLVLLNNDTAVRTPEWLDEMLSLAQWPEVGAVGAKLLYDDDTIQHAGVGLFGAAVAGHMGVFADEDDNFYNGITSTVHEVAGVTAACLMVAKAKYFAVSGLDEVWIPNGWGDVEFCIKLMRQGLANIYTPYAVLYHYESQSRKSALEYFEQFYMRSKYAPELLNDPYLHPGCNFHSRYHPNIMYLGFDLPETIFRWLLTSSKQLY